MKHHRQNGNFQVEENPVPKNALGNIKFFNEVMHLMKYFQTKPQV